MVRHAFAPGARGDDAGEVPRVHRAAEVRRPDAEGLAKEDVYKGFDSWVAKLDTLVHELYHIDPHDSGIRKSVRGDGRPAAVTHTPQFFRDVATMTQQSLDSKPDATIYDFLRHDFAELVRRHGTIVGTTFRSYPSFPQRYRMRLAEQPRAPRVPQVVPMCDRNTRPCTPRTTSNCGRSRRSRRAASWPASPITRAPAESSRGRGLSLAAHRKPRASLPGA